MAHEASSPRPRAAPPRTRAAAATLVRGAFSRASARPPLSRIVCTRASPQRPAIALSFDDGPHPRYTPAVLEILARRGVRATFFVLGRQIEAHPHLLRDIAAENHEIGVHGYDHSSRALPAQARRTAALLARYGVSPRLFRPPRGSVGPLDLVALALSGYRTVLWSFDARDSMRAEGKVTGRRDDASLEPGEIVLLHDDNVVCLAELGPLIDAARARGYALETVSALVAERAGP